VSVCDAPLPALGVTPGVDRSDTCASAPGCADERHVGEAAASTDAFEGGHLLVGRTAFQAIDGRCPEHREIFLAPILGIVDQCPPTPQASLQQMQFEL
jgi:hypothetical protein